MLINCRLVLSMIDNSVTNIGSNDRFTVIWSFEFATGQRLSIADCHALAVCCVGGTLTMTINELSGPLLQNHNDTLQLIMATQAQVDPLQSLQLSDVCASPGFSYPCLWRDALGLDRPRTLSLNLTAGSTQFYR